VVDWAIQARGEMARVRRIGRRTGGMDRIVAVAAKFPCVKRRTACDGAIGWSNAGRWAGFGGFLNLCRL
jgi:hypothetical protein